MRTLRAWLTRMTGLVNVGHRERELAEELESHLQLHIEDNIRAGMTPEEARRAALVTFGSVEAIKEEYRDRSTIPLLEGFVQDLRYGARKLRRQPGFTVLAVVTLALGVGATAAMFSFVDALMFRMPPHIREPHRVVRIDEIANYTRYTTIKERLRAVELAVFTRATVSLGVGPGAVPLRTECVTPSYFPVLGVVPVIGRAFTSDEDTRATELTVVIAHALWRQHFAGDPALLGRRVKIAGQDYTIVGVAPPGFRGVALERIDAWILLAANPQSCTFFAGDLTGTGGWLTTIGRIRDDFTHEQAAADVMAADTNPEMAISRRPDGTSETVRVLPRLESITESREVSKSDRSLALWLAGGAAVLLLIACANVAGLLSMRGIDRRREIAVRLQLGATRRRVFGQLLAENALLTALCALAAMAVAAWVGTLLHVFYPFEEIGSALDSRAAFVLIAFTAMAGVVSGAVPAIQASRADFADHLRTGRSVQERARFRSVLLTAQLALSLMLIVGAGLFVRSVANFRNSLAYDLDHVLAASVDFRKAGVPDPSHIRNRYELMLERVRQLPDVESAALSSTLVLGPDGVWSVTGIGRRMTDASACCYASLAVSPEYFATLGIRIVRGRSFTDAEAASASQRVVILDEGLAKTIFPNNEDPIGHCVIVNFEPGRCHEVVGVSESARSGLLRRTQADSHFFLPFAQANPHHAFPQTLLVRPHTSSKAAARSIAAAIRSAAPDLPYVNVQRLDELANVEARSWRLAATIFGLFGMLSLALAAVGIYGALAFSIRQRTPEIGVRVAFGAEPGDIAAMVVRHGLVIAAIGWLVGAATALASTRYMRSMLFGVPPADIPTFALASCIIIAAVLAGSLVPAVRAAHIDPAVALRTE